MADEPENPPASVKPKEFELVHVINNVSALWMSEEYTSTREEHFNIPWKLSYCRNEDFLGVRLCCELEQNTEWSVAVKFEIRLSTLDGRLGQRSFERIFRNGISPFYGDKSFVKWDDLLTRFVIKDSTILEATVTILGMDGIEKPKRLRSFAKGVDPFADVVIQVEDEKFHFMKGHLIAQSTVFHAMYMGRFKESIAPEVNLGGVTPDEFQQFLELIHLEPTLTDTNIYDMLRLADMYDAKNATCKRKNTSS